MSDIAPSSNNYTSTDSQADTLQHNDRSPLPVQNKPESNLAIVFQTHNNELVIGSMVLFACQYAAYVIVVDDNSHDRTTEVASQAGAEVISAGPIGGGRLLSIRAGCRRAVELGYKAVALIDSGDIHHIRDIPLLATPVLKGEADLVIGSRTLNGRHGTTHYRIESEEDSCTKFTESREFCSTNPDSTFRALSVRGVELLNLLPDTDTFESDMIALFSRNNYSIMEIPITLRHELSENEDDGIPRYKGLKVAVVVPAYNEELLLGDTLKGIPNFIARVYVVNDCSTDKTQEIIDNFALHSDSIVPIRHEKNRGVGAAIVSGYKKAFEDGMDIVAVMGGDDQMDPAFLPELLQPIIDKKCDYTMGNRLINPVYRKGMSTWRFFGNAILTMITKIASGYWQMMDPQNGYTAISKRALEQINLDDIYTRYGYCNDLLVKLNVVGFRVINVPHPARYGREKSGIKYSTYILKVSWLLLRDFLWRLKMKYIVLNFHPLVFFYVAGVVFSMFGILLGGYALYWKFIGGNAIFVPLTLSLIVFGIGIQALFFAMFYDMEQEKNGSGWY